MLTRKQKEKVVKELADNFSKAKTAVFTNFHGLKVAQMEKMRKELRNEEMAYKVAKKTLIKFALKDAGFKVSEIDFLKGSIGVAFGYEDGVKVAKIIYDFAKSNQELKIIGGIFNKSYISDGKVEELAKLPSKEELLAKLVWTTASPISGFVNAMTGNLRSLVYVIKAIGNK